MLFEIGAKFLHFYEYGIIANNFKSMCSEKSIYQINSEYEWGILPQERTHSYLEEVSSIANKLDRKSIDSAIGILYDAWKNENQVFIMGNGGSAFFRRSERF